VFDTCTVRWWSALTQRGIAAQGAAGTVLVCVALGAAGCGGASIGSAGGAPAAAAATSFAPEATPAYIALEGPCADATSELSGLAWDGDALVLLPQFPDRLSDPALFVIERREIADALAAPHPVEPRAVPLELDGLVEAIDGYEGFEAIAIDGDTVTLAIEVREAPTWMRGVLVHGVILRGADGGMTGVQIDASTAIDLPAPAPIANKAYEAIVDVEGGTLALFELTTPRFVEGPSGRWVADAAFDHAPDAVTPIEVAPIVGRWTDATTIDADGRFFVVNYVWPGDAAIRDDAVDDALARAWGIGASHLTSDAIERVVELHFDGHRVTQVERAPTWIALDADEGPRNWEGIARWSDDAVVLVTDRFPGTRLAVVPLVVGLGELGAIDENAAPGADAP